MRRRWTNSREWKDDSGSHWSSSWDLLLVRAWKIEIEFKKKVPPKEEFSQMSCYEKNKLFL